jgi:hypothetical protein
MERELLIRTKRNTALIFILLGGMMNLYAISLNGGKMPVLFEQKYETTHHFTYQDLWDVNYPFLTDIINLRNYLVFSVGDIIVLISLIIYIYFTIKLLSLKSE